MTDFFPHTWQAKLLNGSPMIMPTHSFVFPQAVPGEEDALARGASWIEVKPANGGSFVAQCALGFASGTVASGLWSMPNQDDLLAVAGGYAYRIPANDPTATALLPMRPVVSVHAAPEANALVLIGFHDALVLTEDGMWQSPKLTWEGVTEVAVQGTTLTGKGWHMPSDKEHPFTLDLVTQTLTGGGFNP